MLNIRCYKCPVICNIHNIKSITVRCESVCCRTVKSLSAGVIMFYYSVVFNYHIYGFVNECLVFESRCDTVVVRGVCEWICLPLYAITYRSCSCCIQLWILILLSWTSEDVLQYIYCYYFLFFIPDSGVELPVCKVCFGWMALFIWSDNPVNEMRNSHALDKGLLMLIP